MLKLAMIMVAVVVAQATPQTSTPPSSTPPSFIVGEPCPVVELGATFNETAFAGRWYRFGGLPNMQELSEKCTTYDYRYTGSGYEVLEEGQTAGGAPVSQTNMLTQPAKGVGEFVTEVDGLQARLQVLTTDYTSLACLYTCHTVRDTHRVHFAWILSRDTGLATEKIASCQVLLKDAKVPLRQMEKTIQGPECQ